MTILQNNPHQSFRFYTGCLAHCRDRSGRDFVVAVKPKGRGRKKLAAREFQRAQALRSMVNGR